MSWCEEMIQSSERTTKSKIFSSFCLMFFFLPCLVFINFFLHHLVALLSGNDSPWGDHRMIVFNECLKIFTWHPFSRCNFVRVDDGFLFCHSYKDVKIFVFYEIWWDCCFIDKFAYFCQWYMSESHFLVESSACSLLDIFSWKWMRTTGICSIEWTVIFACCSLLEENLCSRQIKNIDRKSSMEDSFFMSLHFLHQSLFLIIGIYDDDINSISHKKKKKIKQWNHYIYDDFL